MKNLVYLLVLFVTACATNVQISEAETDKEIMPLTIGNIWNYVDEYGNNNFSAEIQGIEIIDGKEWFVYRELTDASIYYVSNTDDGQIEYDFENSNFHLVLPYPVANERSYGQFGTKSTVIPNVTVTVPAGTFNTYKYTFGIDDPTFNTIYWVSPGVGVVKITGDFGAYELVSYKIQ